MSVPSCNQSADISFNDTNLNEKHLNESDLAERHPKELNAEDETDSVAAKILRKKAKNIEAVKKYRLKQREASKKTEADLKFYMEENEFLKVRIVKMKGLISYLKTSLYMGYSGEVQEQQEHHSTAPNNFYSHPEPNVHIQEQHPYGMEGSSIQAHSGHPIEHSSTLHKEHSFSEQHPSHHIPESLHHHDGVRYI